MKEGFFHWKHERLEISGPGGDALLEACKQVADERIQILGGITIKKTEELELKEAFFEIFEKGFGFRIRE